MGDGQSGSLASSLKETKTMPAISKKKAVEVITAEIKKARYDDLAEYHNELFPSQPTTAEQAEKDPAAVAGKVLAQVEKGLEIDQILDLWPVIFPGRYRLWYDEEKKKIHWTEDKEIARLEE